MWLFDKIKKMFDKSIALSEQDKQNLVTYVKLKGKTLKLGQEIFVNEGYNLASVYYNRFCDVVGEGKHALDETTLPKMYRLFYNATRKENDKIPDEIADADLYFINLKQMAGDIRTGKIRFLSNEEKVKARLKCSIEYKICDIAKFMEYFANEFAILKNNRVVGEVEYFIKDKIKNCLERTDFDDLFLRKADVENLLLSKMQELKEELGVEVAKIVVNDVEVPKKYLGKKIIAKNKVETNEEVLKMVEDSINGVKEEQKVYVNVAGNSTKNQSEQEATCQNAIKSDTPQSKNEINQKNSENLRDNFSNNFATCEDIINDVNKSQVALLGGQSEPYVISDAPQEAPNLFEEPRKKPPKEEKPPKVVTKYKVVIKCPCCGAKNDENAEFCMVCKSKL